MALVRNDQASQTAVVKSLMDWLSKNLDEINYGEVGLVFTVHDGKPTFVDKVLRKKEKVG